MDVSENSGTPKASILIGFSIINNPFWGTPIFWKHPYDYRDMFVGDLVETSKMFHPWVNLKSTAI